MRSVAIPLLMAAILANISTPALAHGFVAVIRNETPLEVGVRWSVGNDLGSSSGDVAAKDLSARIRPDYNASFSTGFSSMTHYKLYVFNPVKNKWTQFDYDQVLMNKDRYGIVTKIGENGIDWLQAWDPTDWFTRKK
jgi:hypothetical protein